MSFSVRIKRAVVSLCLIGILYPAASALAYQYTVVTGDTLFDISKKTSVSIEQIKAANSLNGDLIQPGQVLNIPDNSAVAAATTTGNTPVQPNNTTYTVKPGDSLYVIAQKYNINLDALLLANSLSGNLIHPGQQLILPIAATRSTAPMAVEVSRSAKRPELPYTEDDLDLLARLVTAEAGGEPINAQVGVAAVVINRVQSGHFQNSIRDVIYAPSQFSPVRNGWINRPATKSATEAAKSALFGSDPTNGALYFFDDSASNHFLRSLPVLARYGNMIYAKK